MFEQFVELQARIRKIVDRAEALILDGGALNVAALAQGRWELTRTLREYQLFKHGRIFDPLERGHDERARQARAMKAECIRVGGEFQAYVLKWSVMSIADHWEEYRPAALDAIARVRAQLARERAGVEQLLGVRLAAA